MSKIALEGNASGTGTFTIASPNSNNNRTLNLPDSSGTLVTTGDTIPVSQGGTGVTSITANNVVLGNGTSAIQTVAPGASGNLLTSNGTTWTSAAPPTPDVQTFDASGTWTKPSGYTMARIQVWGAGGGGGRHTSTNTAAGGGGGAYNEVTVPISYLAASVSVTVGSGGAGATATGSGGIGGTSSVTLSTAWSGVTLIAGYGGGGGSGTGVGGGGGGQLSAGATAGNAGSPLIETHIDVGGPQTILGTFNQTGQRGVGNIFGGGSGAINAQAGNSVYGGGGGASSGSGGVAGVSVWGGNGGRNAVGVAPGGGGGSSGSANVNGSAGAAGRVIITSW